MSIPHIDFSCKHDIMIRNADGTLVPMDEPWFTSEQIAPGTWKIQSSGDYCYLVAGDGEAMAIDCGYGAGNIREYMEELCGMPVRSVANTHDHFDHTACNALFDRSYSSAKTAEYATIPYPSFSGIDFHPDAYERIVVEDGEWIPLKGRNLLALSIPDHAPGSMMFLDPKEQILFTGDEIFGLERGKPLNGGLTSWIRNLEKVLAHEDQFDRCYGGGGFLSKEVLHTFLDCAKYALEADGEPAPAQPPRPTTPERDDQGRIVYDRRKPYPGDKSTYQPSDWPEHDPQNMRLVEHAGTRITFDSTMKDQ